jgi:hypothetical protein
MTAGRSLLKHPTPRPSPGGDPPFSRALFVVVLASEENGSGSLMRDRNGVTHGTRVEIVRKQLGRGHQDQASRRPVWRGFRSGGPASRARLAVCVVLVGLLVPASAEAVFRPLRVIREVTTLQVRRADRSLEPKTRWSSSTPAIASVWPAWEARLAPQASAVRSARFSNPASIAFRGFRSSHPESKDSPSGLLGLAATVIHIRSQLGVNHSVRVPILGALRLEGRARASRSTWQVSFRVRSSF